MASQLTWSGPQFVDSQPSLYLTFDDGPHPVITRQVIEILGRFEAPATFFCVGENIEKHPEILEVLVENGHAIGNHSYAHESGWSTSRYAYLKSFLKCQTLTQAKWFRPPYGRITRPQAEVILAETEVVMWDVLSADFDVKKTPEDCLEQLLVNTRPGAIVVFHDSVRAAPRLLNILEPYLRWLRDEGYACKLLLSRT
tara:strand:+ start:1183 stop:1776 length:594 start_codon:yes stop_codon:yes gene_type:complete